MVMLTQEVKNDMDRMKTYAFCTSSAAGEPNVAAVGLLKRIDDETIWAVDNFMVKTLKNVKENPRASVLVWSPDTEGAWQVKCDVTVESEGEDYQAARKWAHEMKETLPAKNLLVLKVTDVYNVKPGPDAGKKVV